MDKRIPPSVLKALKDRHRYASLLLDADSKVSAFCIDNDIDAECINLHVAIIGEPDVAYRATLEDILSAGYKE